ncbi:leukosialin isoform X2 [Notechis scutatus]|uniref:Leukosialin isoform X2 n=1 Tax=Notechis scutatus TaxID=8663 RepID=A0A6J1V5L9_9SAUR|nr:leukosialin isoform X2 [Notechis scutatus]
MLGEQSRLVVWFFLAFTYSIPRRPRLWNSAAMEKSRSLIRQVIGHKMLFVVFLLFLTDILVEVVAITNGTTPVNKTDSLNISASGFPASSQTTEENFMTSVASPPDATTPDTLNRSLSTPEQPALSLNAAPLVPKQELQSDTAVTTAVPEDTSSPMRNESIASTKEKHPLKETTKVQKSKPPPVQQELASKMIVTSHFISETVSSPTKDSGTRSQGSFFKKSSATAYPETTKSREPKDDRKGPTPPSQAIPELTQIPEIGGHYMSGPTPPSQAVPELTQIPEIGGHYMSGPFTTSVTPINDVPIFDSSDKRPSEKKKSVIILAIVFSVLLLVGLLVFLYFRRRRHSGSTSFNSPEWAGQATLPDDTGLDKDVEQQVGSVGEGETRRGTLVTFFGKRQSRVPSIAMEEVNGKGGKEETEKLLCEEAENGSSSEAIGDANGKVPEPLKESSQESPASNKD